MKIQKPEITATLPCTEYDFLQKYQESFLQSEQGRIHAKLPLKEIAEKLILVSSSGSRRGRKPLFPPEGEVVQMFLKPYTGLSDDGMAEVLNGSLHMQMFCGVLIDPSEPLENGKIVSAICNRLAVSLGIGELQKKLYGHWKADLTDTDMFLTDAFCYESHHRFPTDVKLLWECYKWLYGLLVEKSRLFGEMVPKTKYSDIEKVRLVHAKLRAKVMDGSLGNQKLHYGLGRISARNRRSEILQIFFGIHMANASIMAARQLAKEEESKQRRKSA